MAAQQLEPVAVAVTATQPVVLVVVEVAAKVD
jgi:hypothetical protein